MNKIIMLLGLSALLTFNLFSINLIPTEKNLQKSSFILALVSGAFIEKKYTLGLKQFKNAVKIERKWVMFNEIDTVYYKNGATKVFTFPVH